MSANQPDQSSKAHTDEVYVSVDVETAGPVPGEYSMLAVGACLVNELGKTFYSELQPINNKFVPEAMQVSGLSFERLRAMGMAPVGAMRTFRDWILRVAGDRRPVFVGFNACFDWAFVNWYFHTFLGENPFGIGGVDIKSYYMGLAGCRWRETSSSQLPAEFQPAHQPTHNAQDDARAQAEIFAKLLAANRQNKGGPPELGL